MPDTFRYTDENPYIGKGFGRNVKEGKRYTGVEADVAEFEDMYLNTSYNGGWQRYGLGIDEYISSSLNISRKNYADKLEDGKVKLVGNSIKSRKMSGYLEKFIDRVIVLLLNGEGNKFINEYYDYIEKIYNYQIPIKDIASKGNIKKSVKEYIEGCKTLTKSGSKKSRQAWYELVIKENIDVNVGDTIMYVNTGTKKGHADVKRITHIYTVGHDKVKTDITKEVEKLYKEDGKLGNPKRKTRLELAVEKYGKGVVEEDEVILNCKMVPREIIDSDEDVLCSDYDWLEYNVEKYIDQFNNRIKPLLVCFHPDIRDSIIIKNPKERKFFTDEEASLVSGMPVKPEDQDRYEVLMTPERKEVEFWLSIGEVPPFVEECGIQWDEVVGSYYKELEREKDELFKLENEKYLKAIDRLTKDEVDDFEENGKIPPTILSVVSLGSDMRFYFKEIPDKSPSTGGYVFDDIRYRSEYVEDVDD